MCSWICARQNRFPCVENYNLAQQYRNQERSTGQLHLPKFLQTWWHSRTSHEKLFLESALPPREVLKTTFSDMCCIILDKTINQSMYHASENSQHRTGDKLWGVRCEVKPVPSPRGDLVGLSTKANLQAPPNWNMKRFESLQFLSTWNDKPPSTQT